MAAGIPPLVSEYCGAAEIAKKVDEKLLTSLNPEQIVKRIVWLKSNKKKYYKLSKKCKEEVKNHTKEISINEFKNKFSKLIERIE